MKIWRYWARVPDRDYADFIYYELRRIGYKSAKLLWLPDEQTYAIEVRYKVPKAFKSFWRKVVKYCHKAMSKVIYEKYIKDLNEKES